MLGVAGLAQYDQLGHALMIPGAYLAINLVQSNLVTPLLLGHRLTLNPVAIFVGLAFFFWIWGVTGAFLAVPLLATMKIFCDHIESLAALGEFLGQRDSTERRLVVRGNADQERLERREEIARRAGGACLGRSVLAKLGAQAGKDVGRTRHVDAAQLEPLEFAAVTTTRNVWLTSAVWTAYVWPVAPAIAAQLLPAVSHRCHW